MKKGKLTSRRVNAIIAAAMAVTLAVPSTAFFNNAQEAMAADMTDEELQEYLDYELPQPIASYDFERGFRDAGRDASGNALTVKASTHEAIDMYYESEKVSGVSVVQTVQKDGKVVTQQGIVGNQPVISQDSSERNNVFTLLDTVETKKAYVAEVDRISGEGVSAVAVDAEGNPVGQTDSTTLKNKFTGFSEKVQSGATIQNPYAGRTDLSEDRDTVAWNKDGTPNWKKGVTISYWVKGVANQNGGTAKTQDSSILYFETNTIKNAITKNSAYMHKIAKNYSETDPNYTFDVDGAVTMSAVVYSTPHYQSLDDMYKGQWYGQWVNTYKIVAEENPDAVTLAATVASGDSVVSGTTVIAVSGAATKEAIAFIKGQDNSPIVKDEETAKAVFKLWYDKHKLIDANYNKSDNGGDGQGHDTWAETEIEVFGINEDDISAGNAAGARSPRTNKIVSYQAAQGGDLSWIKIEITDKGEVKGKTQLNTMDNIAKLSKGDKFQTEKGWWFEVVTADAVNGEVVYKTSMDPSGYTVISNYGKYCTFNPNFPAAAMRVAEDGTLMKVGNGARNVNNEYGLGIDDPQSAVEYAREDDTASLSFNLSGSWLFQESPMPLRYKSNKNGDKADDQYINPMNRNYAVVRGDTSAESLVNKAPGVWHFVTYVIQNDHISTYYDGELMDEKLYQKPAADLYSGNQFNIGSGYNSKQLKELKDVSTSGVAMGSHQVPDYEKLSGNRETSPDALEISDTTVGMTIMELLTREDTLIHLGGTSLAASLVEANGYGTHKDAAGKDQPNSPRNNKDLLFNQYVGTAYGTAIDDLTFYDVVFNDYEVKALYLQSVYSESGADKVEPIVKYEFAASGTALVEADSNVQEDGSDTVSGPVLVEDASKGSVVKLTSGRRSETCALKLENPFVNRRDITGASVSYWVKQDGKGEEGNLFTDTTVVSFYDTTPTAIYSDKGISEATNGKPNSSIIYSTTQGNARFAEMYTHLEGSSKLKNTFTQSASTAAVQLDAQWHYMTMVMTNDGIKIYRDGVFVENTAADTTYGERFYDGYFGKMKDLDEGIIKDTDGLLKDKSVWGGTNNSGATTLLSFLNNPNVELYLGFNRDSFTTNVAYSVGDTIYVDDVALYDVALTDSQIAELYEDAKKDLNGAGDEEDNFTYGDVNNDGYINATDAVLVLQYFANMKQEPAVVENLELIEKAGDVNADGFVNASDAVLILQRFANMPEAAVFPAEKK